MKNKRYELWSWSVEIIKSGWNKFPKRDVVIAGGDCDLGSCVLCETII